MTNAILHISDLHFVDEVHSDDNNFNDPFKLVFFKNLETELSKKDLKLKYVIISGDISDNGKKKQFVKVEKFLNDLIEKFKLDKKYLLICPGNHDINWDLLSDFTDSIPDAELKETYMYHDKKFERFKVFYDAFFNKIKNEFIPENAVVDVIDDDEDCLLIVGLNSCYKESEENSNHFGFIHYDTLKSHLNSTFIEKYENYNRILVFHHNPKELNGENTDLKNWKDIKILLNNYFPTILCGHIHASGGIGETAIISTNQYYVPVGSFAKKIQYNSFNLLHKSSENPKQYKVLYYHYTNLNNPFWQELTNIDATRLVSLQIDIGETVLKKLPVTIQLKEEVKELPHNTVNTVTLTRPLKKSNIYDDNVNKLIHIIKENKLFKSGHFHWSQTFRSHGIIDINYLISHKETIDLISYLFNFKLKEVFEKSVPDLILGLGIEGNVIGARLSVIFPESTYSFIPDSPKDKDYSSFEQNVLLGQYNKIVLIKDILFEADNLKEILKRELFKEKDIYIFSLFYCGCDENSVFNVYPNVRHYSICNKIKINTCKNCVTDCSIIEHGLDKCYTLYTPEEL